jgi:hypothetical protein
MKLVQDVFVERRIGDQALEPASSSRSWCSSLIWLVLTFACFFFQMQNVASLTLICPKTSAVLSRPQSPDQVSRKRESCISQAE